MSEPYSTRCHNRRQGLPQTKIPMLSFASVHQAAKLICFVSLMEDGYSVVNDLSGETKSLVLYWRMAIIRITENLSMKKEDLNLKKSRGFQLVLG